MTSSPHTNSKQSRKYSDTFLMDQTTMSKRSKQIVSLQKDYFSSINLMKFAEITPIDSSNQPHPRSGHRAVATESDFWIWGGFHPATGEESPMFNEV